MQIRQVSVFIENKSGRLAAVTRVLGENNITIRAMNASDTIDFGILRLVVDNPDLALQKLKEAGFTCSITSAVALGLPDEPGSIAKAMDIVYKSNLSVEYIYAFTNPHKTAYIIIKFDDNERAAEVLSRHGLIVVSDEDIASI